MIPAVEHMRSMAVKRVLIAGLAAPAVALGSGAAAGATVVADAPLTAYGHDVAVRGTGVSDALLAHFFDADASGTAAQFTATVDWGDGTAPSAGSITTFEPGSEYYVRGSHVYPSLNTATYVIHVTILDSGGASAVTTGDGFAGRARRLAVTGTDGAMWVRGAAVDGAWYREGGDILGGVAVAAIPLPDGSGSPLYVAVGTDHALWAKTDDGFWYHLSSAYTYCLDTPAATVTSLVADRLWVACEGSDHGLWVSSTPLSGQTQPVLGSFGSVGGSLTDGPALIPDGSGGVEFLVNESDGLVHTWTAQSGFTATPWRCTGRPAAAFTGFPVAVFACRGTDDALWYATSSDARAWGPAHSAGGTLTGPPAVAQFGVGDSLVAVEGTGGTVWELTIARGGGGLTPYHLLGGDAVDGTGAVATLG